MNELATLRLDDLQLDELDVTSLRDSVGLPAMAASTNQGSGSSGNGSCTQPQLSAEG